MPKQRLTVFAEIDQDMSDWLDRQPHLKKAQHVKLALEMYRLLGPGRVIEALFEAHRLQGQAKSSAISGLLESLGDVKENS